MYNTLKELISFAGYSIAEFFNLPSRKAHYRPIPDYLFESLVGNFLNDIVVGQAGLWNHQALALEILGQGNNVVVSTGTASGKSLIFQSASFHHILLNPDSRILVFYPLKALANDQERVWLSTAQRLNLDSAVVGRIDGSIPLSDRDDILEKAKIVLMTPDVCHAWLMSRLSIPLIKNFLASIEYIVMDEAHTLEGVFGSNFAFLLRRLMATRRHLLKGKEDKHLRFIATTATISNPDEHMKLLTGMNFDVVDEKDDGSPKDELFCYHLVSPEGDAMQVTQNIQTTLLRDSKKGSLITFVDSRKGVEMLAKTSQAALNETIGDKAIMPYRAGYNSVDRENIEKRLRDGTLRGIVSTSALELGIDIPHLTIGLNIGVPATRKAYRQRLGRIGRSNKGAFVIIGPHNAFKAYGTTFEEYHRKSVEESYLYLDNRFMQFAHSRCLSDELEAIGAPSSLPTNVAWPTEFSKAYAAAKPGGNRPPEFDAIAQLGGDSPQHNYPLRNVGELAFKITRKDSSESFGEISDSQALRECYPGATYLHMGKAYEVMAWNTSAFHPFIKVKPAHPNRKTTPRIRTWINTGIMPADLLDSHLLISDNGFIAECQMQITEKVEGYKDQNGQFHPYQNLRQINPNMRPRQRNYRTSGVLLCIQKDWFKVKGMKQFLSDWISNVFCREYSILPQDVNSSATNISVRTMDGGGVRADCLVLFDQTYGSLRLTERLFLNFELIIQRLKTSAKSIDKEESDMLLKVVEHLEDSYSTFQKNVEYGIEFDILNIPPNCMNVFKPGSMVYVREVGNMGTEAEILQPTWMEGQLVYQVKVNSLHQSNMPAKHWVAAKYVEQSANADAWDYVLWNAETEEFIKDADINIQNN